MVKRKLKKPLPLPGASTPMAVGGHRPLWEQSVRAPSPTCDRKEQLKWYKQNYECTQLQKPRKENEPRRRPSWHATQKTRRHLGCELKARVALVLGGYSGHIFTSTQGEMIKDVHAALSSLKAGHHPFNLILICEQDSFPQSPLHTPEHSLLHSFHNCNTSSTVPH